MIGCPTEHWLEADTKLPELDRLFDYASIARLLHQPGDEIVADYIRYKPGTNALVRLVAQGATGPSNMLGYAKTYAAHDAAKLKAIARKRVQSGFAVPITLGQNSQLFPLPADNRLRSLWRISSPTDRIRLSRRLELQEHSLRSLEMLAYKPEKRCVLRATATDGSAVVVKLLQESHWLRARTNARLAAKLTRVPGLRGWSRRYGALVYDYLPGQNVRERMDQNSDLGIVRECGDVLGRLHGGVDSRPKILSRQDEVMALDATAQLLLTLLRLESPQDVERTVALHAALRSWLGEEPVRVAFCHGDFYDKQLLSTSEGVVLLDFDDACIGDARLDVANFVAHRIRRGDQEGGLLLTALIDGYPAPHRASLRQISVYVAVRLFLLSHHPFRARQPNWLEDTRRLLDLCWHWYEEKRFDY